MPGVLVDSSSSPSHSIFPGILSGMCLDGSAGLDTSSLHCDLAPASPQSPLSLPHFSPFDVSCSSAPSIVDRTTQRFLPKSNLGLALGGNVADSGFDYPSELGCMPIPSPRKSFYVSGSTDGMVGSPLFSDGNGVGSPVFNDTFSALHKFLPSNTNDDEAWLADAFPAIDVYSCDDFRIYEFKVRRCMRGRSHDWTECPFAHPGEKARRRDPRRIHYSGTACPDFRKGSCKRGDTCEFAHGVFECWLHPARYRTQPCKDGRACRRRVCFFAHTVEQLRVLPSAIAASSSTAGSPCKAASTYDGSSLQHASTFDGLYMRQAPFAEGMSESMLTKEDKELSAPRLLQQKVMESKGLVCGAYGVASSPTSTLHGYHPSSPPPLSPPFSPSSSPPKSPDPYMCWSRNSSLIQPHPQSPLSNSSPIPAHRRHLNRLQTMPTISVPSAVVDQTVESAAFDDFPFGIPISAHSSHSTGVSELLHSLQALQLHAGVRDFQKASSLPCSPQSHNVTHEEQPNPMRNFLCCSIPGTPGCDAMWDLSEKGIEMAPPVRIESGRDLRAKIYGKIGKENGVESNVDPDLGWVNELIK